MLSSRSQRGRDVVELALLQDCGPDGPSDDQGENETDDDDECEGARPDRDDEEEGNDHDGKGQGGVDDPSDKHVERATEIALGKADRRSDNRAQKGGKGGDLEDVAGADYHPGQNVLTDVIGPEPVGGRRGELGTQDICLRGGERSKRAPEDGADDPPKKDQGADDEGLRAKELAKLLATDPADRDIECAGRTDGRGIWGGIQGLGYDRGHERVEVGRHSAFSSLIRGFNIV